MQVFDSGIPKYDLEHGLAPLTRMVMGKMAIQEVVIVGIVGGSSSGKTDAVAKKLQKIIGQDAIIYSMDDLYLGVAYMETEATKGNILNFDQPESQNLLLLCQHLKALKAGKPIQKPIYDFETGETVGFEELKPHRVIIVEGLFTFYKALKKEIDIKVFVDVGTHGRAIRRILRDIKRTGQKPADILAYFARVVQPMHERYIEIQKKDADLIIGNEYRPEIEAQRSGLSEVQLKFPATLNTEFLRSIGAERLGTVIQTDTYYNPLDRDLRKTGEALRIRKEGSHIILTYKGPAKIESRFRERPKIEFEIDADTEGKFLEIYGRMAKIIEKERDLHILDGIIISIDTVSKIENGKTIELGKFLEIRTTKKGAAQPEIDAVLAKLGLSANQGLKESYVEM